MPQPEWSGRPLGVCAGGDPGLVGRLRYGRLRPDGNPYLQWAFVEAAHAVAVNHSRCSPRPVRQLCARLRARPGHSKAIGAVARHLAEAAFYVLSRQQPYRDPARRDRGMNATHLRNPFHAPQRA